MQKEMHYSFDLLIDSIIELMVRFNLLTCSFVLLSLIMVHQKQNNAVQHPGPGCSKLRTSLVNIFLKFQKLIFQIRQYFLLKKCEKLLSFFNKKYQCIW